MSLSDTELRKLPKVELHRHLEGSVRFETVRELAQYHHLDMGITSEQELREKTRVIEPMNNLEEVLEAFWTTQKVFCAYEAVERITFENIEDAFHDGIKLLELRFAPVFMAHEKSIGLDELTEGVMAGMKRGMEKYKIQVGLIHILPRGLDMDKHEESTTLYLNSRQKATDGFRLCGFDLADSETTTSSSDYVSFIEKARQEGLGITIHTGENTTADHVRHSIEAYNPARIGHGIKSILDPELIHIIKEKNIHLEVCPTSNWLTRSVDSMETHPLPELFAEGVSVSINSDDPHMMGIDLVNEYRVACDYYQFTPKQLFDMNRQAIHHSFLEGDIKDYVEYNYFNY